MTWFIYDFFDPPTASQAWRSNDGRALPSFVKALAVDLPQNFSSIKCNEWAVGDYIGGLRVRDGQTCVFRICNGGRDSHGRPNRWVLLVALADSERWRGTDVFSAVESPIFNAYAIVTVPSPAPMPTAAPAWLSDPNREARATPDSFDAEGSDAEARARDCSLRLTTGGATAGLMIVQKQAGRVKTWFKLEEDKHVPSLKPFPVEPMTVSPRVVSVGYVPKSFPFSTRHSQRLKWYFFGLGLLLGIMIGLLLGKAH